MTDRVVDLVRGRCGSSARSIKAKGGRSLLHPPLTESLLGEAIIVFLKRGFWV